TRIPATRKAKLTSLSALSKPCRRPRQSYEVDAIFQEKGKAKRHDQISASLQPHDKPQQRRDVAEKSPTRSIVEHRHNQGRKGRKGLRGCGIAASPKDANKS